MNDHSERLIFTFTPSLLDRQKQDKGRISFDKIVGHSVFNLLSVRLCVCMYTLFTLQFWSHKPVIPWIRGPTKITFERLIRAKLNFHYIIIKLYFSCFKKAILSHTQIQPQYELASLWNKIGAYNCDFWWPNCDYCRLTWLQK